MLNLFVLIILEQFEENYLQPNNPLKKYKENASKFKEIWAIFTEENLGINIHLNKITDFMLKLDTHFEFDFKIKGEKIVEDKKVQIKDKAKKLVSDNEKIDFETAEKIAKNELISFETSKAAAKAIMKMNISSDADDFIYFNDLLYASLKLSYYSKITDKNTSANALKILNKVEEKVLNKFEGIKKKVII